VFNFLRKSRTWKQYFEEGTAYGVASDFKKAEESFRHAVRLAPNEPYPHYELGYTLSLLGKHKEALEEFEATDRLARGFFQTQTEAYLSRQIISGGIDQEVLAKLRYLQRLTDTNAKGEETFVVSQQVVALAPTCALGYFHLGKSLLGSDPVAAEQALHKCIRLGPDDTTAINAKFHLGILKRDGGQVDVARRIWAGIAEAYPGNPHTKMAEMLSAEKSA
jgi:tetratricopeptide (TPR) repeat protein